MSLRADGQQKCGDDDDSHARAEQGRAGRTEAPGHGFAVAEFVVRDLAVLGASARIICSPERGTLLVARDGRDLVLHRIRAGESGEPPSHGTSHRVGGLALIGVLSDISIAAKVRRRVKETRSRKSSTFCLL